MIETGTSSTEPRPTLIGTGQTGMAGEHFVTGVRDFRQMIGQRVKVPAMQVWHLRHKFVEAALRERAEVLPKVWDIDGKDDADVAARAIAATEDFFQRMGCPVHVSALNVDFDPEPVVSHLERAGHIGLGEHGTMGPDTVRAILRAA